MHCVALWRSQWSQQEMDEQQATYGSTHSEDIAAISEHDSVDGWSQVPSSLSASEPEANLQEVWTSIIAEYEAQDAEHRYGHMRQSMFTTKSRPKLKGKAAEVKDMGPVMLEVFKHFHNPNLAIHQKILVVLEGPTPLRFY